jgi:hypothetical protein
MLALLRGRDEERVAAMVLAAMYGAGKVAAAAYNSWVNLSKVFKSLARVTKTFQLEVGPVRAQGVPAVLVAVTGVVLAAGVVKALNQTSDRLPETIREARALAQTFRPEHTQLPS